MHVTRNFIRLEVHYASCGLFSYLSTYSDERKAWAYERLRSYPSVWNNKALSTIF